MAVTGLVALTNVSVDAQQTPVNSMPNEQETTPMHYDNEKAGTVPDKYGTSDDSFSDPFDEALENALSSDSNDAHTNVYVMVGGLGYPSNTVSGTD